jgi:cell division protein FtsB
VPAVAGGLAAAGGGVAALGGAAALAAGPIGLLVVGVGATVLAIRRLNQRIDEQSQSLSAYSATLASAQARAQVANLRQDIRSAQSLGPELAALVESQTRRDVAAKQIADKFESFILPIRTSMMKVEATVLESLVSGGGYLKTVAQGTLEVAAGQAELGDIMKRIEEQNKKAENKKNNEFIQAGDFRGLFDSLDELDISDPTGDVNSPKVRRGASVGAIGFGSLPMLP